MSDKSAIIIGAGIVGLALARSLSIRGYSVTVFERNAKAVGASVRNFGMVWPIGQPEGKLYERALTSKSIWKTICSEAGLWYEETGSLHVAQTDLEWKVLQEVYELTRTYRPLEILSKSATVQKYDSVNPANLKGALFSSEEMIIESRVAIEKLPAYLTEKYGVRFHFNTAISEIRHPAVISGKERWEADYIFLCSGVDFETLYPEIFQQHGFTKCKLQMMRFEAQPEQWRIGPALCGGLSLVHYKSFQVSPSLSRLKEYYEEFYAHYLDYGIHVMVCQNAEGELTIGDSHEYHLVHDPFDKQFINDMIISYLESFFLPKVKKVKQTWHGIYPKLTEGRTEFVYQAEEGVVIVNGLGGNGMTLSLGLAEEIADNF